jgi:hypothetical protein
MDASIGGPPFVSARTTQRPAGAVVEVLRLKRGPYSSNGAGQLETPSERYETGATRVRRGSSLSTQSYNFSKRPVTNFMFLNSGDTYSKAPDLHVAGTRDPQAGAGEGYLAW